MGTCSACLAKYHKHHDKNPNHPLANQAGHLNEENNPGSFLNRSYTIGPPLLHIPDHPLASYTFPRSHSASIK